MSSTIFTMSSGSMTSTLGPEEEKYSMVLSPKILSKGPSNRIGRR